MPGYINPTFITESQRDKLSAWLTSGGVLLWAKVLGPESNEVAGLAPRWQQLASLAGVAGQQKRFDVEQVRLNGKGPATLWLDVAEERQLRINPDGADVAKQVEVFTYTPSSDAETLASAVTKGAPVGATWLRRAVGEGAVYTLGFDPTNYTRGDCYVNCFDPGVDVAVQLVKGAWREASRGHLWSSTRYRASSQRCLSRATTSTLQTPTTRASGASPAPLRWQRWSSLRG